MVNEEFFGLRGKIKEGMDLWKEMENNPEVESRLEENISKLSEGEKEVLRRPGLLKRIMDFFAGKSEMEVQELVSEGFFDTFERIIKKVGVFFSEFGIGISTLLLVFTGVGAVIAGGLESKPMLVVIGVIVAAIGSIINKLSSDDY